MKMLKELVPYVVIILLVVLVRTYIISPVRVSGDSMFPTLEDGEILLLKKYEKDYQRFDIIVFEYNGDKLVKRVIGLPGEHVKYVDNSLYINDKQVFENFIDVNMNDFDLRNLGIDTIPEGKYFVVGDNRNSSMDSRIIGLVDSNDILGTTSFSIFPFDKFGSIDQ